MFIFQAGKHVCYEKIPYKDLVYHLTKSFIITIPWIVQTTGSLPN